MWKNIVQSDRPQVTIWRWIPKATNTLRIGNTYSFSTATMVERKNFNVTLWYIACLVKCSSNSKRYTMQTV